LNKDGDWFIFFIFSIYIKLIMGLYFYKKEICLIST
jgi:hypothetical protein